MNHVKVLVGNLFESRAQTLTNTVNTVGVMGKGIALKFRRQFPEMFEDYTRRCAAGQVRLGEPYLYRSLLPPWILNFPTKEHWRSLSRLEAIEAGIDYVVRHHKEWGIESLAVPPLGCGEGGLEWRVVGPTLYRGLARLDVPVELYAPFRTPHGELEPAFLRGAAGTELESRIPVGGIALAAIVGRITTQRHAYPIGRVGLQKTAYFATQAGVPTGLEFERRPYGPFAAGLKRLIARLIDNGLIEESPRGRMIQAKPGPTLADAERAYADDLRALHAPIERVTDLLLRFPTTRHTELAASVHYVATALANRNRARGAGVVSEDELVDEVWGWKKGGERPPSTDEIRNVVRTLAFLGWIDTDSASRAEQLLPA